MMDEDREYLHNSINRNIVECKVQQALSECSPGRYVLIETLWNVKLCLCPWVSLFGVCINRNIVECKETCTTTF